MQEGGNGGGRVLELLRKRASADASPQTKSKRKQAKVDAASKATTGVLQGRKVLVVPIGSDVSRKRVEIWQEMVEKLGGVNVALHLSGSDQQRRSHNKTRQLSTDSKSAALPVQWDQVDIAIVSAQLDQEKAKEYLHCDQFPPSTEAAARVKVYTPEWLIFLMREKQFPVHDGSFEWAHVKKQQVEAESHQQQLQEAEEAKATADDEEEESPVEDEGSDIRNRSNQEIQRAPPVNLDLEKLKREEDELQAQKDQLVKERAPIFFANNPGFKVIAEGLGGKPMKPEAFVCQKSSSTYFVNLVYVCDSTLVTDIMCVDSDANEFECALDRPT